MSIYHNLYLKNSFIVTVLKHFDTGSRVWSFEAFNIAIYFYLELFIWVKSFSSKPTFSFGKRKYLLQAKSGKYGEWGLVHKVVP